MSPGSTRSVGPFDLKFERRHLMIITATALFSHPTQMIRKIASLFMSKQRQQVWENKLSSNKRKLLSVAEDRMNETPAEPVLVSLTISRKVAAAYSALNVSLCSYLLLHVHIN